MMAEGTRGRTDFGQLIKARRQECGVTQADLAERVDVTHKTISAWETGLRTPDSPATLKRLATGLDIAAGTAEYAALRAAWEAARRAEPPAATPETAAGGERDDPRPDPSPPAPGAPPPDEMAPAPPRWTPLATHPRGWIAGGSVLLVLLLGAVAAGVLLHRPASPRLLPGYVMATAAATACASAGCSVYDAHLTQAYQRSALARQVHLVSDLSGNGRSCTVTPASVSAQVTLCNACRTVRTDLGHEYAFMVYTVTLDGRHASKQTTTHWLRLDYAYTTRSWSTHGSGTPPPWTHPRHC